MVSTSELRGGGDGSLDAEEDGVGRGGGAEGADQLVGDVAGGLMIANADGSHVRSLFA